MARTKNSIGPIIFLTFGIVTIISGIYLVVQGDRVIGIFGTITGMFLLYLQYPGSAKRKDSL